MIKIANLPVKSRIPTAAWVLAGLVALFSMIQVGVTTKPANGAHYASVTYVLDVWEAL